MSGEASHAARVEEALNLFVDTTNCLDSTVLVDRAGDGKGLLDRRVGESRQQREEFGS